MGLIVCEFWHRTLLVTCLTNGTYESNKMYAINTLLTKKGFSPKNHTECTIEEGGPIEEI